MNTTLFSLLIVGGVVWLVLLSVYVYRVKRHYDQLVKGSKKETLSEVLDRILQELDKNKRVSSDLDAKLDEIVVAGRSNIQKVGILRFNPFADTGGDQSFILALLDGEDNGIVLTSLHGRGMTRWYAKNVVGGKGEDHQLSSEEQKAIRDAVSLHDKRKNKKSQR
ncbi:DUF4446 family protein [Candidatus Gottesmanbacteria bacterium]|nr:DUF4446 family protein [Candidatus Gottesmanbacteria bacterium]